MDPAPRVDPASRGGVDPVSPVDPASRAKDSFLLGVILFGVGAAIGAFAVYDAGFSRGSGEWAPLVPLFTLFLDGPLALVLFGVAFMQAPGRHRTALIVMATILAAMPGATFAARRAANAVYRRDLERSLRPAPAAPVLPLVPRGLQ